jgi:hypothetical protein
MPSDFPADDSSNTDSSSSSSSGTTSGSMGSIGGTSRGLPLSTFEAEYSRFQQTTPASSAARAKAQLLFEGCVSQAGLEFCKVRGKGGPWLLCPAGEGMCQLNE